MDVLLGSVLGGLLAIMAGLLAVLTSDFRERRRARQQAELTASAELLAKLQTLVRRLIDLAYMDKADISADRLHANALGRDQEIANKVEQVRDAMIGWNSAMYTALLVCPPKLAGLVPGLDREVDNLCNQALRTKWSRRDFRVQRIRIGQLAADYLHAARLSTGQPAIDISSIWAWESDAIGQSSDAG